LIILYYKIITLYPHGRSGFAEISKNLARYKSENLLNYQKNYVGHSNCCQNIKIFFAALLIVLEFSHIINLMVQQNYFQICI